MHSFEFLPFYDITVRYDIDSESIWVSGLGWIQVETLMKIDAFLHAGEGNMKSDNSVESFSEFILLEYYDIAVRYDTNSDSIWVVGLGWVKVEILMKIDAFLHPQDAHFPESHESALEPTSVAPATKTFDALAESKDTAIIRDLNLQTLRSIFMMFRETITEIVSSRDFKDHVSEQVKVHKANKTVPLKPYTILDKTKFETLGFNICSSLFETKGISKAGAGRLLAWIFFKADVLCSSSENKLPELGTHHTGLSSSEMKILKDIREPVQSQKVINKLGSACPSDRLLPTMSIRCGMDEASATYIAHTKNNAIISKTLEVVPSSFSEDDLCVPSKTSVTSLKDLRK